MDACLGTSLERAGKALHAALALLDNPGKSVIHSQLNHAAIDRLDYAAGSGSLPLG